MFRANQKRHGFLVSEKAVAVMKQMYRSSDGSDVQPHGDANRPKKPRLGTVNSIR